MYYAKINLRVSRRELEELRKLSKKHRVPVSELVRSVLRYAKYYDYPEDYAGEYRVPS